MLAILSGLSKAIRDTVAHHWNICVFSRIKYNFWFKWFRSDWRDKPSHPIWFLWDAWHCFDTLSYAALFVLIYLCSEYWEIGAIMSAKWLGFNVFYHKILLIKGSKEC